MRDFLARNPKHPTVERVVDDRLFLVGLDELYRTGVKLYERTELLAGAQAVASALEVRPDDAPVEGYYAEDDKLKDYFRLMRALQRVDATARPRVANLRDFQRLLEVVSSPLFGEAVFDGKLFPMGRDPLSRALHSTKEWTGANLTELAYRFVSESDDYSLVGLACLTRDAVVITALRESVVLYAEAVTMGVGALPVYIWRVSPEVAKRAERFVATFNALFNEQLPAPTAENADVFGAAGLKRSDLTGRCVRIGKTDDVPTKHYHWAIFAGADLQLAVHEFWHDEVWTTQRYRTALPTEGVGPADLLKAK
jgi:hypothetical protein